MSENTKPKIRRAQFALDEGDVVITYPEYISEGGISDLEEYLALIFRSLKRQPPPAPEKGTEE